MSVLFADLVGFTSLSEHRDPEEVRELLSRYFETCNRLIGLYGGTVEKFIGDAVMAVWGTPTATEDDAERAVRAALDLVAAVSALGDEVGASELRARAGVLTGEAAVTIGAEGQGMVAGDLVNTASRIQSAAEPGSVLVGETTRRTTEQAIVYEDVGAHTLKGKDEPKEGFVYALETALALGRSEQAGELVARVERISPGNRPPYLDAQAHRFRGRLEGDPAKLAAATAAFDELRLPFWAAASRLEHAELLGPGEERERLLGAARGEFERLGALPWLERVDAARPAVAL